MAIQGVPRTLYDKFKFRVECADMFAGFQKCSELELEVSKIEHYEGGTLTPDKTPGRVKFSDITLERGACADLDMWAWMETVYEAASGLGGAQSNVYKRTLDIVQMDRAGLDLKRWRVVGAWPTKFTAGDWDNDADEKVIEKVVLAFDFFIPIPLLG